MPPLDTTLGQLLINDALPEDMRDFSRVFDKKGLNETLRQLALKHPDKYREVSKKLADIGRRVSTQSGGNSFGLAHMRKAKAAKHIAREIQGKLSKILDDDSLDDTQRRELIVRTVGKYQERQMEEVLKESLDEKNPLGLQILSGSRGNKMNLASLRGSDLLYADHRDEVIPLPVLRSYSEGLTPAEYWAGTYGARRGVMATKFATQDAGYLSKQLNQVSHRLMVTDLDGDGIPDTPRGLPADTDDMDNEGSLLAQDVGSYKRNTVLTPKILKDIKARGHARILVRSPLVGGSPEGGVYARDVGVRERGTLPGRGEMVGLLAAQALSEPLSQAQLAAKHSGGVAGQEKALGGFEAINQLVQTPKVFKGGAAHTEVDGRVEDIQEAPAGGNYVTVDGKRHYVAKGFALKVKRGDEVEAGDVLSEGFPNPAVITQHKGHGEGRRYLMNGLKDAFASAGIKVHRRNLELLSRGLINHVRLTEETDHHVPDDVVPYSTLEHTYQPREGFVDDDPKKLVGHYLERPVLHYSIGTRIRPSVAKQLAEFSVNRVVAHPEPPPFQPEMIRGMASLQHDPDWMTRMYGSGLKSSLLDATHRGSTSTELGTSFVPGLARAVDFGRVGMIRPPAPGLKPDDIDKSMTATPAQPAPPPSAREQPDLKPNEDKSKKPGLLSGLFKWSSIRNFDKTAVADPLRPKTGLQPKSPMGNPLPSPGVKQPQTQQAKPYNAAQDYVAGTASNDLPAPGQQGAANTQSAMNQQGQSQRPYDFTGHQYMQAQQHVNTLTGQPTYNPYQGQSQGWNPSGNQPQTGYSSQGGYVPDYSSYGYGHGQAPQAPQAQSGMPGWVAPTIMAGNAAYMGSAMAPILGSGVNLASQGSSYATAGSQATQTANRLRQAQQAASAAQKAYQGAQTVNTAANVAKGMDNLATAQQIASKSPAGATSWASRLTGFGNQAARVGRWAGKASPWIGMGIGALDAGLQSSGAMGAEDPEWEEWKRRHAEAGHSDINSPISFDPNMTGWRRYAKKQQMKFFDDMNPYKLNPFDRGNWKGVFDNPAMRALGNLDKVYNPVGTAAAVSEMGIDMGRLGGYTYSDLMNNANTTNFNRANNQAAENHRQDTIRRSQAQANSGAISAPMRQDLEKKKVQQGLLPAGRETEHLNALETTMHNATTRPGESVAGGLSSFAPLAWAGSEISGGAGSGYTMNPFTSRRVRLINAGGYLPWG